MGNKFTPQLLFSAVLLASCSHDQLATNVDLESGRHFAVEAPNTEPISDKRIGLALAGGGTKAASFAMGVLAGLNDSRILSEISAISSVSGGGYAAYFYYARLIDTRGPIDARDSDRDNENAEPNDWFKHCLTKYARRYFVVEEDGKASGLLTDPPFQNAVPVWAQAYHYEYCPSEDNDYAPGDPYRFQNHVAGFQDFLISEFNYKLRSVSRDEWWRGPRRAALLTAETVISLPFHWMANYLFNWRVNLSPSKMLYEKGITRTYGYSPGVLSKYSEHREVDHDRLSEVPERHQLSAITEIKSAPEWIINATATDKIVLDGSPNNPLKYSYELSTRGFGSVCFGYSSETPKISIPTAVTASAAFFDFQQRQGGGGLMPVVNSLLAVTNLSWGSSFQNSSQTDNARQLHAALPFPLYMAVPGHFRKCNDQPMGGAISGNESLYLHLSDGGQSENLGLLALIRRKIPTIIVSDHSQDQLGQMQDFCNLANAGIEGDPALGISGDKPSYRFIIVLDQLQDIDKVCAEKSSLGYNVLNWKSPIITGRVWIESTDKKRNDYAEAYRAKKGHHCPSQGSKSDCLNLIWIKPAIDIHQLAEVKKFCKKESKTAKEMAQCHKKMLASSPRLPPSVIRHVIDNWSLIAPKGWQARDPLPLLQPKEFPQDRTAWTTIDSSAYIFMAYRDLGRAYASIAAAYLKGEGELSSFNVDKLQEMVPCKVVSRGLFGLSQALDCSGKDQKVWGLR